VITQSKRMLFYTYRDPAKRPSAREMLSGSVPWVEGASPRAGRPLPRTTTQCLEDFNRSRKVWRTAAYACALVVGLSPTAVIDGGARDAMTDSDSTTNTRSEPPPAAGPAPPPGGGPGVSPAVAAGAGGSLKSVDEESQAAGLRAAFAAIDTDHDGSISQTELRHVIGGLLGPEAEDEDVDSAVASAFARLDRDHDGALHTTATMQSDQTLTIGRPISLRNEGRWWDVVLFCTHSASVNAQ
jgi:hypothetical protein